jgi:hypothetical protein
MKGASDLLTEAEAAEYLRRPNRTLADWRMRGEGPPYLKTHAGRSGRVLYRRADLEAWVESKMVTPSKAVR